MKNLSYIKSEEEKFREFNLNYINGNEKRTIEGFRKYEGMEKMSREDIKEEARKMRDYLREIDKKRRLSLN